MIRGKRLLKNANHLNIKHSLYIFIYHNGNILHQGMDFLNMRGRDLSSYSLFDSFALSMVLYTTVDFSRGTVGTIASNSSSALCTSPSTARALSRFLGWI